jgi:hypothetical protein
VTEEKVSALLATFMDSAQAKDGVSDPLASQVIAMLLIAYGLAMDGERPTRVSPSKLAAYVLDHLPTNVAMPERFQAAVPETVRAWTAWAAAEHDLPPAAVDRMAKDLDEILAEFPDAYADSPANDGDAVLVVTNDGQIITKTEG